MTRKQKRLAWIGLLLVGLAAAVGLILVAMQDSIVFFHTPSDITEKHVPVGQRIRLGGLVETGSVKRGLGTRVEFKVTDTLKTIDVVYDGILPDLFREGQGVIAEGTLAAPGSFKAETVLAKHDEKYMPPEVERSLKDRGLWREGSKPK